MRDPTTTAAVPTRPDRTRPDQGESGAVRLHKRRRSLWFRGPGAKPLDGRRRAPARRVRLEPGRLRDRRGRQTNTKRRLFVFASGEVHLQGAVALRRRAPLGRAASSGQSGRPRRQSALIAARSSRTGRENQLGGSNRSHWAEFLRRFILVPMLGSARLEQRRQSFPN